MTDKKTSVFILTIEQKHASCIRAFQSEEGALDALAKWARHFWPREVLAWPEQAQGMTQAQFDALSDGEAIAVYFEVVNQLGEFYGLDSATLEG